MLTRCSALEAHLALMTVAAQQFHAADATTSCTRHLMPALEPSPKLKFDNRCTTTDVGSAHVTNVIAAQQQLSLSTEDKVEHQWWHG